MPGRETMGVYAACAVLLCTSARVFVHPPWIALSFCSLFQVSLLPPLPAPLLIILSLSVAS